MVAEQILRKSGLGTITANSGQRAIEILQSGNVIDGILLDCEMSEMSGYEVTKRINIMYQEGELDSKPFVIGYSAFGLAQEIDHCIECGMDDFLKKPAQYTVLVDKIMEHLHVEEGGNIRMPYKQVKSNDFSQ